MQTTASTTDIQFKPSARGMINPLDRLVVDLSRERAGLWVYLFHWRRISPIWTWRGRRCVGEVVVVLPVGTALTLIGGLSGGASGSSGQPRDACHCPHYSIYSAGDRGSPTSERLGAPDQGAVKGNVEPLGSNVVEINLTTGTTHETRTNPLSRDARW
jgi:hypothetical protein